MSASAEANSRLVELFSLTGRVAIVTGASSGLGQHFATTLADAGATVVTTARRVERLEAAAAARPDLVPIGCDVADQSALERLVDQVHDRFGRIDIVVNNAGTSVEAPAEDETISDFRRVVDVNLHALFGLSQSAGRKMLEAGAGSIVNVASIFGLVASSPVQQASYCASKGAVVNLTRELAAQWASRGVRVNALAPGWFPSELTQPLFENEDSLAWVRRNTPMRRPGLIDELDGALLLLASDAGSYITGQVLSIDGGWTTR